MQIVHGSSSNNFTEKPLILGPSSVVNPITKKIPKEMTKEEAEKYTINFGKHKGKLLIDLIKEENPYIDWLLNNSNNQEVLKAIELLTGRTPKTEEEWDERMPLTLKLVNVINEKGLDVDKICEYYKVKTTNELSDEQIKEIIEKRG